MRRNKKFSTEKDILDEIDRLNRDAYLLTSSALKRELEARTCLRDPSRRSEHKDAMAVLEYALKDIAKAANLRSRVPALGRKLAEIRTETMAFLKDK